MDNNNPKNELPNKLPPQNIEAEKSVLGCLMLSKNAIVKVIDFLEPSDFYLGIHQKIYQAMVDLFQKNEPIDLLSVSNRLKEKNELEDIGDRSYLTVLVNSIPTAAHVVNYAKIVRKVKILRDLIAASYDIAALGYNESEDVDILLDKAEKTIFSITQNSLSQSFLRLKSILGDTFERLEKLSSSDAKYRGVPTGFTELDNLLSGLQKSDLVILAARPSLGKSSLALDIARHIAVNEKKPVGIFSLEMSKDQIADRILASQANISLWKLRTGKLSSEGEDNDIVRIQHALGILNEAPVFIDDAASANILQIRAMARRLQSEHDLSLIIIDYLQLMEPTNPYSSSVQQVTEISRSLKGLARELNVPVLALSQLSRAVEQRPGNQRPRLSDLRESGSIEQDADVVMFIYRKDKARQHEGFQANIGERNIAEIIIAKHRNGPIGSKKLYFDEEKVSFRSLTKEELESFDENQQSGFLS